MACKGNRKDLQMTKQYIAMRALRVRIGSFFWADKSFSLKILSTILMYTFNATLACIRRGTFIFTS